MTDRRQEELWCHGCSHYVQFMLDYDLDGRHLLNCPNCGHEHYRIVRRGQITAERWGQDPRQQLMQTIMVTTCTSSVLSIDSMWIGATATSTTWNL